MKNIIIVMIAVVFLGACASDHLQYNQDQFTNSNYQKNILNSIDYADNFIDFDETNIPKANLEAADLSILIQADVAFNQGEYAKSAPAYYYLANKYRDPRLIYKAIIGYEHFSSAPHDTARLNQMVNLLEKVAPDSKLARLFSIRIDVENGDFSEAKNNLKAVIKSNPEKARAVLLFLSTIMTNDYDRKDAANLDKFAGYVADKYSDYPEAGLFAVASYSISNNKAALFTALDSINSEYPKWEVPVYWSAGVLIKDERLQLLISMLDREIKRYQYPSPSLQNLYVAALIRTDRLDIANAYIESSLKANPGQGSLLINSAIINYKLANNSAAIQSLLTAKQNKVNLDGAVDFAIASLYDYNHQYESAIRYYKSTATQSPLLTPSTDLAIFRAYASLNQYQQANNFLDTIARATKLGEKDTIILKATLYTSLNKYDIAYDLVNSKIKQYGSDSVMVYLYASLSGFTNRTSQSLKWYRKYIALNPNDPVGYNDLAFLLAENSKNYTEAKTYADRAYSMSPKDPAIQDTIGWVYYKLGDYPKAQGYLESAYQQTHDSDTAMHLKQVYLAQKMADKADKVVILSKVVEKQQQEKNMLNQAILILMYYQYGLDLSR